MPAPFTASVPFTPEGVLEPGDRFELTPASDHFLLPEPLIVNRIPVETLEDETGQSLTFTLQPEESRLLVPPAVHAQAVGAGAEWLEFQARGRFRLLLEPGPAAGPEQTTTEQGIPLHFDSA